MECALAKKSTGRIGRARRRHSEDLKSVAVQMLPAGGGLKPGDVYGETDEFGYLVANNEMTVRDPQATPAYITS